MNEMNQLQSRLRSWVPRPPSAKIKARLFSHPINVQGAAAAANALPQLDGTEPAGFTPRAWPWLAPAAAILFLSLLLSGRSERSLTRFIIGPTSSLVATVALNHPHLAAYCVPGANRNQNVLLNASFEWTNGSLSLTTAPSLFDTNGLKQ